MKSNREFLSIPIALIRSETLKCYRSLKVITQMYMEIEKNALSTPCQNMGKSIRFKRNIRIANYRYDFIGVSQNNSIDLLVEVKYWENISALVNNLSEFCHRAFDAGIAYETIMHLNFR